MSEEPSDREPMSEKYAEQNTADLSRASQTPAVQDLAEQNPADRNNAEQDQPPAEQRLANAMRFVYPEELPVCASKDEIREAVENSRVTIVSGQTGSGKTTQIPKILLQAGYGENGKKIMLTQPRRIAARSVAERIAQETGTKLGDLIGFRVRFTDKCSQNSRLIVATDGILLSEIQSDRRLEKYDAIIIDEAHERSLNIDFLLGYLSDLLQKRSDLKLVITSATIDSEKFKNHFEKILHCDVPVIEVSGRTWPVQIVYEPADGPACLTDAKGFSTDEAALAPAQAVTRACAELADVSAGQTGARDILVFAAGERDIREYETALRRYFGPRAADLNRSDAIEIIPLYARLSSAQQHKVFEPHTVQRIVLATNVAETSLTVPSVRYVVDPGFARIARYSKTAKVQRLPIEPISQASANQRSGRCGRIAEGIAIRLYSQDDFESRPEFTDPEIMRTALSSVVLRMLAAGMANCAEEITGFGFIDPPDMKAVSDGFNELVELGAIVSKRGKSRLTRIGRLISRLPVDVRLARMIIEASDSSDSNTVASVAAIAAFLSLSDMRERPSDKQDEADRIHKRYADDSSDFLTILNIWDAFFGDENRLSNSAMRKKCAAEYFNFLRMRQWKDLFSQLCSVCEQMHIRVGKVKPSARPESDIYALPLANQAAGSLACSWDDDSIHDAILSGLLSYMGMQTISEPKASDFSGLNATAKAKAFARAKKNARNNYRGARGIKFSIFPSSAAAKKTPQWIMCAGLLDTSRLWARYAAQIDPARAEKLGKHLTRTTYSQPFWSKSHGAAQAKSNVLLYGLPIVKDKPVMWTRIDPEQSRSLLIRCGLVEGQIAQRFSYDGFIDKNRAVLTSSEDAKNKTRKAADAANEEDLFAFYDSVIPENVATVADLALWVKKIHDSQEDLLNFSIDKIARLKNSKNANLRDFPDFWTVKTSDGKMRSLKLSYVFDSSRDDDGITVHIPIQLLSELNPADFSWNVPGNLNDLIIAAIKSLPKNLRVKFVPAPDKAAAIREKICEKYPILPGANPADAENSEAAAVYSSSSEGFVSEDFESENFESKDFESKGFGSENFNCEDYPDSWPDFFEAFAKTAGQIDGIGVSYDEIAAAQKSEIPRYLRLKFSAEQTVTIRNRNNKNARPFRKKKVLGTSLSLEQLQNELRETASRSARKRVEKQARKEGEKGNVVNRANMLHKAGACEVSREIILWQEALEILRLPELRITSRRTGNESLILSAAPYKSAGALTEDLQFAAIKKLLANAVQIKSDEEFRERISAAKNLFEDAVYDVTADVVKALKAYIQTKKKLEKNASLSLLDVLQQIDNHLSSLIFDGFIGYFSPDFLHNEEKYIRADEIRLEKAQNDKNRDIRLAYEAAQAEQILEKAKSAVKSAAAGEQRDAAQNKADQLRMMYEEFRVSLWAQELKTSFPISIKRMSKVLNESEF